MAIRIEEAFNDCFDRLTFGESLDSCLRRYPEYAAELDMMLRMAYDVKRRAYPIQPRPEFKYWSRVRLQGVQDYMSRHAVPQKSGSFSFRRNLAISMAGLLVLVIATSGTAAASNNALPDQPLYGVKMAVEQAQVSLATSDIDRAEIYAKLAEKRAQEIESLARQGKAEYLVSTSAKMDYQLEQAETYIGRFQAANTVSPAPTVEATTTVAPADETSSQPAQTTPQPATQVKPYVVPDTDKPQVPPAGTSTTDTTDRPNWIGPTTPEDNIGDGKTGGGKTEDGKTIVKQPVPASRAIANVSKAKTSLNSSTAKSLATLQAALDKAPESAKPAIIKAIERVKKANEWSQVNSNGGQNYKPPIIQPRPKYVPPTTNWPSNTNKNTSTNTNTGTNTGTTTTTTGTIRPTTILTDTQKLAPSTSITTTTSDENSVLSTFK